MLIGIDYDSDMLFINTFNSLFEMQKTLFFFGGVRPHGFSFNSLFEMPIRDAIRLLLAHLGNHAFNSLFEMLRLS